MRKSFFLILCFFLFLKGNLTAIEDPSRIIRRAYLDLIGTVPTTEEIDWYLVYNENNGYDLAITYLYNLPKNKWKEVPFEFVKVILNSIEYRTSKRELSKEEIEYIIFYVSGDGAKTHSLDHAKRVLIKNCLKCCDSDVDKIDYLANNLMSRNTKVNECNILIKVLKENDSKSEQDKWLMVLDKLMTFEDVVTK